VLNLRQKFILRRGLSLLALLLLGVFPIGCFDNRRTVAFATLTRSDGQFDESAFVAALQARFPPGTRTSALSHYVASARGECHDTAEGFSCLIPLRGMPCMAELVLIKVSQHEGAILSIDAKVGGLGC
jgi:hypothetical protein